MYYSDPPRRGPQRINQPRDGDAQFRLVHRRAPEAREGQRSPIERDAPGRLERDVAHERPHGPRIDVDGWIGLDQSAVQVEIEPMVIEMRTYKLKPGKRAEFLEIFRTRSMPAHAEIGMKILGPFLSIEDEDTFFFMRGFPDLPSREPMKARFYEGGMWKRELEHVLMPMIDNYQVVLVDDPDSWVRWP